MAARNVLRDVGRVLGMPYSQVDAVAKMIPVEQNKPLTIEQALKRNPEFSRIYEDDPEIRNLVDMAKRLEGLPRHTSMHAAGVVISQKEVDEYVPLSKASDGSITTQFTMTTLEELGLLKMDFLGLRTLTVIQDTVRLVEKNTGVFLDMDRIDYNDAQVLASIGTGKTEGVFQLESAGMKNFMKELKPQSLEDIIAGVALYRPGPMDFIPQYIRGKNNAAMVTYDCPQLRPILESTYGCIVYQEQVMQIVRDLGGYTMGRSDLLRRAMSKKKISVMEKERQNFVYGNEDEGIPGCIKKGIDEKTAHRIYDEMIDFAKYAFNKSHAAAYAVVAYQTAYLKYYYPVQYMAALMTSVIDFPTKVSGYILHCRQIGIDILPPDINRGDSRFSVDGNGIRYGLSAIKSVGRSVIDDIVKERELGGPYTTLNNFLSRMSGKEVNKRVVENLIRSGAMDCLEGNRKQKLLVYQRVMDSVQQEKKNSMAGQLSLLDIVGEEEKKDYVIQLPPVEEYEKEALLAFEKEVLGIYISGHPLEKYTQMLARNATAVTTDFLPDEDTGLPRLADGSKVTVGGMITNRTIKYTKTNQVMAFITVEDLVGTVEVIVFPKTYERSVSVLEEENKVFVQGRVAAEDDKASKLICEKIYLFTDIPRELWIQFPSKEEYRQREGELLELIGGRERKDVVVIYLKKERAMKRLPPGQRTAIDSLDMEGLKGRFGEGNIRILEKDMGK